MTATDDALNLIRLAAKAADDRSGFDQVGLDVSETMPLTDAFLIVSGRNERMVLSIAEEIEDRLREELGVKALRREGRDLGRWVLIDFGDLVVHVFHEEDRLYYSLERIWRDAPVIDLQLESAGEESASDAAGASDE
ncbi:ribosome silencing factor [Gulosibacter macacae]|uniref:Ribosomal silencing factor RsfS n=1 Tax=Gulosibacter macacae TaxID=2488791 RepID=A0A3P3W1S1_9MICO|nr:ribosome silencing factor [Gulosibacter macacae]RRJ87836.1 ribosome silencing factor [Gulosibacter macacae]